MVAQERQRHGGEMKMIVSLVNLVTFKAGEEGAIFLMFICVDISLNQMHLDDSARNNWISTCK